MVDGSSKTCILVSLKLLVLPIPIAAIVIGALYLDSCPVQRYIPIYLLVTGVFTLSLVLLTCLPCKYKTLKNICGIWNIVTFLFIFCWVIAGSTWIYPIYQPNYNYNSTAGVYCDKTVYLFAFGITTLFYIVAVIGVVLLCCGVIFLLILKKCLKDCGKCVEDCIPIFCDEFCAELCNLDNYR